MFDKMKANPRTTCAGIGTIVAALGLGFGWLSIEQATVIGFAFAGIGQLLAGDAVAAPPKLK